MRMRRKVGPRTRSFRGQLGEDLAWVKPRMLMAVTETMDIMKTSDYSRFKRPFVKCDNKIEIVMSEMTRKNAFMFS